MGTQISEIADLFMTRVNDYRLNTIFTNSGSVVFNQYVEPWLLSSIVEFDVCNQSLDYTVTSGSAEGEFTETLTLKNKIILSQILTLYWLEKSIQETLQMQNLIQDKDFKMFSQAQNLDAKRQLYNNKREEISQILVNYGYANTLWSDWRNQDFAGSG